MTVPHLALAQWTTAMLCSDIGYQSLLAPACDLCASGRMCSSHCQPEGKNAEQECQFKELSIE